MSNLDAKFTWVQTHKEIAQYLAGMEDRQEELVQLLKKHGVKGLHDEKEEGKRIDLEDMDPFSFFCFIHKYGDTKRLKILQEISNELGLSEPEGVAGIPSTNPMMVMMFYYTRNRNEGDISNLWELFHQALNNNVDADLFETVLGQSGVGKVKITETLFYVDPEKYFPVNGPTKPYMKEVLEIDPSYSTWQDYLDILDKIREKSDSPFYKISHEAWAWLQEMKKKEKKFESFQELIDRYKNHLKEEGIEDERYKWEAIHHFQKTFDPEAEDFADNFKSATSKAINLVYQNSIGFIKKAVTYYPEEVREMFRVLYDETKPLENRFDDFVKASEELLPKVIEKYRKKLNHQQDERTLSYYLAMRYPENYPIYKNDIYNHLLSVLGNKDSKAAGEKYFHYRKLAEELIPLIESDGDLMEMIEDQLTEDCFQGDQKWIIFQDILWINLRKNDSTFGEKWDELLRVVERIDDDQAVRKFFETVRYVLNELDLSGEEEVTYASAIDGYIQFTIGSRYVTHLEKKKGLSVQGFYVDNDYLDGLKAKNPNLKVSDKALPPDEGDMTWVTMESWEVHTEDFFDGITELARKGIDSHEKSPFRIKYESKHNPWIAKVALNDSLLEQLLDGSERKGKLEGIEVMYPLNTIFYGPPGTGKTYNTIKRAAEIVEGRTIESYDEAKEIFNRNLGDTIEFITFHQNYSYEDFIQGLRPDVENSQQLTFERTDGIFKKLADKALKNWKASQKPQEKKQSFEQVFNEFIQPLVEGEVEEIEVEMKRVSYFITAITDKSIEFRKASGGTAHTLSINTLRKMYEAESVQEIKSMSSYYSPLLDVLLKRGKTPGETENVELNNYVIIIDEINRANISRVFGELITLIEPDKRHGREHYIPANLPSGERFSVPVNLYIIGTMNTADKSIALLDIALRRRFEFEAMYPKYEINGATVYDSEVLKKINQKIVDLKGQDFQIGHSYFMDNGISLKERMNRKVIPLLLEYFMNDEKEVRQILEYAGLEIQENTWPMKINGLI